jgi:ATP-dependent phosphofructokinase / diphosphate-dependent phosphofructokinase
LSEIREAIVNILNQTDESDGRLVVLKNGRYDNIPIDIVTSTKKNVNVERFYNKNRLRPKSESFELTPLFIMTSDAI